MDKFSDIIPDFYFSPNEFFKDNSLTGILAYKYKCDSLLIMLSLEYSHITKYDVFGEMRVMYT